MFEAYSQSKQKPMNVKYEFNLNEEFSCLNSNCTAKFKIKSTSGKKAKHFARLKSTPHIQGCPYEKGYNKYLENDDIQKSAIEDIFEDEKNPNEPIILSQKLSPSKNMGKRDLIYIRTPKQLLKYCIANDLKTEYQDGITVNDIILDNRNLLDNGNLKGVTGIRMILAETINYKSPNSLFLKLWTKTKKGDELTLHINVMIEPFILKSTILYMLDTYGDFGKHNIAIFGDWKIDNEYHISCNLKDRKHIIYKF